VTAGQVLARLDDRVLQLQLANAQANLASAQAQLDALNAPPAAADLIAAKLSLANAQVSLQQLTSGSAAADVASARSSLLSAQTNLATLQAGPDPVAVQNAQAALQQAKNSLWSQQLSRDAVCVKPGIQCDEANATVGNGEIAVSQDQAALDRLLAGPTQANLQEAQLAVQQATAHLGTLSSSAYAQQVAAAQLQVQEAQVKLDALNAGPAATDLAKDQAGVESAKVALAQAQLAVDNATLRAPFAGILTAVNVTPGTMVSSGTAAVTLLDRGVLHVDLKLSENDVVKVQAGQPVTLTIDSLNGKALQGTVGYVSPAAETTNGVVTFAVRVDVPTDDQTVRIGMTANVSIVAAQKSGVLLVPNTALVPLGNGYAVRLVSRAGGGQGFPGADGTPGARQGGTSFPGAQGTPSPDTTPSGRQRGQGFPGAQGTPGAGATARARGGQSGQSAQSSSGPFEVPVQIGLTDGTYTEILGGLREGDTILALATASTGSTRATGAGGLFGALFGGLRGGGPGR
jgi:HlyD family secretion protein